MKCRECKFFQGDSHICDWDDTIVLPDNWYFAFVERELKKESEIMTEKLKPCPFCGGNNLAVRYFLHNGAYHVCCDTSKCNIKGPNRLNKQEAIEAWNRRAYEE